MIETNEKKMCIYDLGYECRVLTEKVCNKRDCTFYTTKSVKQRNNTAATPWVYKGKKKKKNKQTKEYFNY